MVEAALILVLIFSPLWSVACLLLGFQLGARTRQPVTVLDALADAAARKIKPEKQDDAGGDIATDHTQGKPIHPSKLPRT